MTVAPKLQKGLKRLFSASVLRIIAALCLVASAIALLVSLFVITQAAGGDELTDEISEMFAAAASGDYSALDKEINMDVNIDGLDDAATAAIAGGAVTMLVAAVLMIASPILLLIAWIMNLVGLINVSKENNRFKIALFALLASIAVGIIGGIAGRGSAMVGDIATLVSRIAEILVFLFVCDGIRVLGEKLGRSDFLGKYNAIYLLFALASLLDFVSGRLGFATIVGNVIRIVSGLCFIISFVLYMTYLRKAIKAVEGVPVAEPQY